MNLPSHDYNSTSSSTSRIDPPSPSRHPLQVARPLDPDISLRPIRVLCLDGSGQGSGSAAFVCLYQLMRKVAQLLGETASPKETFDLIVGTGIGGIIALLVARLDWSVQRAFKAFGELEERVFAAGSPLDQSSRAEVLKAYFSGEEMLMDSVEQCKVAIVLTSHHISPAEPILVRSYQSRIITIPVNHKWTILETALAAISPSSHPAIVNRGKFNDASNSGYSNPSTIALRELQEIAEGDKAFGERLRENGVVVTSIGAGVGSKLVTSELDRTLRVAQDTERAGADAQRNLPRVSLRHLYHRFNTDEAGHVPRGEDYKAKLEALAVDYLQKPQVRAQMKQCSDALLATEPLLRGDGGIPNATAENATIFQPLFSEPDLPDVISGRRDEIKELVDTLTSKKSALILGVGGLGKTQVALSVLHVEDIKTSFLRRYVIRCESITTASSLITALVNEVLPTPPPPNANLAVVVNNLHSHGPTLLLFDNFETTYSPSSARTEIQRVLKSLLNISTVVLLFTSRDATLLTDFKRITTRPLHLLRLQPLPFNPSREAFLHTAGENYENDPQLETLLGENYLGGHPLSIVLVATQASREDSIADVLRLWDDSGALLGDDDLLDDTNTFERNRSLAISVRMSLDSQYLNPVKRPLALPLLALLAHLPSGLPKSIFKQLNLNKELDAITVYSSLATIRKVSNNDNFWNQEDYVVMLAPIADTLCRLPHPDNKATLFTPLSLPVLAQILKNLTHQICWDEDSPINLFLNLLGLLQKVPADKVQKGLGTLESNLKQAFVSIWDKKWLLYNINLHLQLGSGFITEMSAVWYLYKILINYRNKDAVLDLAEKALAFAKAEGSLDRMLTLICLYVLGDVSTDRDENLARIYFEEALSLAIQDGSHTLQFRCHSALASLEEESNLTSSAAHWEEALKLAESAQSLFHQGRILQRLASIDRELGKWESAKVRYQKLLESALQKKNISAQVQFWIQLGTVHQSLEELDQARDSCEQALSLCSDPDVIAWWRVEALKALVGFYQSVREQGNALAVYDEGLVTIRFLGDDLITSMYPGDLLNLIKFHKSLGDSAAQALYAKAFGWVRERLASAIEEENIQIQITIHKALAYLSFHFPSENTTSPQDELNEALKLCRKDKRYHWGEISIRDQWKEICGETDPEDCGETESEDKDF